jgi:hypothetical protein
MIGSFAGLAQREVAIFGVYMFTGIYTVSNTYRLLIE